MIRHIILIAFWALAAFFMVSIVTGPSMEQIQREDAARAAKIEAEWREIKRTRGGW
jgi:hypothetical protein